MRLFRSPRSTLCTFSLSNLYLTQSPGTKVIAVYAQENVPYPSRDCIVSGSWGNVPLPELSDCQLQGMMHDDRRRTSDVVAVQCLWGLRSLGAPTGFQICGTALGVSSSIRYKFGRARPCTCVAPFVNTMSSPSTGTTEPTTVPSCGNPKCTCRPNCNCKPGECSCG